MAEPVRARRPSDEEGRRLQQIVGRGNTFYNGHRAARRPVRGLLVIMSRNVRFAT